jgi:hypothetical protein
VRYAVTDQFLRLSVLQKSGTLGQQLRHELQDRSGIAPRQFSFLELLRREVDRSGFSKTSDLLGVAFNLLSEKVRGNRIDHVVYLDKRRDADEFAALQAMALLRRLNLMKLNALLLQRDRKTKVNLADASSGEQQILCSVFGLVAEVQSNSLLLIDEPELSLHPRWQVDYLDRLDAVMRFFSGCHVLVATHSPLIVQRAIELGFGVTSLAQPGANGASVVNAFETKSVSIDETLMEVFRTPVSGSAYLADLLFRLVSQAESASSQSDSTIGAASQLERLRNLYAETSNDQTAVDLIEKALLLVNRGRR